MKTKQTEQKEIGSIKLSDTQDLVASLDDSFASRKEELLHEEPTRVLRFA